MDIVIMMGVFNIDFDCGTIDTVNNICWDIKKSNASRKELIYLSRNFKGFKVYGTDDSYPRIPVESAEMLDKVVQVFLSFLKILKLCKLIGN